MTSMIEKMARAICRSRGLNPDGVSFGGGSVSHDGVITTYAHRYVWQDHIVTARACLTALSEPTPEMVEAGANHTWEEGYDRNGSHATGKYVGYEEGLSTLFGDHGDGRAKMYSEEVWQAMITTALKGDGE